MITKQELADQAYELCDKIKNVYRMDMPIQTQIRLRHVLKSAFKRYQRRQRTVLVASGFGGGLKR